MAKYVVLIYGDAEQWGAMTLEQEREHGAAHEAFRAKAGDRVVGGYELALASRGTTSVRQRRGRVVTTDGPFLETKEALGGYYVLEADDVEEVEALVALLPEVHAEHSGVEIRRVVDRD